MINVKQKFAVPRRGFTPQHLFLILLSLLILLTIFRGVLTDGKNLRANLFYDAHDGFMDYFNSVMEAEKYEHLGEVYTKGKLFYPPLAVLYYGFLHSLIPSEAGIADGYEARIHQAALLPFLLQMLLLLLGTAALLFFLQKGGEGKRAAVTLLLFFTAPMIYLLERGNILFLALFFLLLFFAFYHHPNPLLREMALLSLAISAGLKIYPAVFGAVLLSEKRYGEALRCVLYGLLAFLLPFLLLGGFYIDDMFASWRRFSHMEQEYPFACQVGFANAFRMFEALFPPFPSGRGKRFFAVLPYLLAGGMVLLSLPTRDFRGLALLAMAAVMVLEVSFAYTPVLLFPAVLAFLKEGRRTPRHFIYGGLFALLLAPCPFPFAVTRLGGISSGWVVLNAVALVTVGFLLLDTLRELLLPFFPKPLGGKGFPPT